MQQWTLSIAGGLVRMPDSAFMRRRAICWLLGGWLLLASSGLWAFGEVREGERRHQELVEQGALYDAPELTRYVDAVGQRMATVSQHHREIDYQFHVLDDMAVNAMAFPGGYIYVSRGLLAYLENEAQLAAVLGHEVGHVAARHLARQRRAGRTSTLLSAMAGIFTGSGAIYNVGRAYGQMLVSGYGREMELEADALGAEYLAAAGYDPNAMLQVLQVLKDQESYAAEVDRQRQGYHGLYASHPRNDQRLHETIARGAANAGSEEYVEPVGDFLDHLDGLPWGDAAANGVLRGNRFYHGGLDIVVDFPDGWQVTDGASAITAVPPDVSGAGMTLGLEQFERSVDDPRDYLARQLDFAIKDGSALELDGMVGHLALLQQQDDQPRLRLVALVVQNDDRGFLFQGNNDSAAFDGDFVDAFAQTVGSLRRMTGADRDAVIDRRIVLIEARPEDTFESLARRYRMGANGADRLRLLNGQFPRGEPRAGDRIKVLR